MADAVEWDDIESPRKGKGSGGSGLFMKLAPNTERVVRPLRKPVKFFKVGNTQDNKYRSAVVSEDDIETIKAKYPKVRSQQRRACLVFDRDEGNVLRVLEGPVTMFESFKHFKKVAKEDPGGMQGGDFKIKTICPNGVKDRETTYEVEFMDKVVFTEEEKAQYNEKKKDLDLQEIYKASTIEQVEERLFGDIQSKSNDSFNDSSSSSSPTSSSSSSGSSDIDSDSGIDSAGDKSDDPFNW